MKLKSGTSAILQRFLSILLSLCLMLSYVAPAFAADMTMDAAQEQRIFTTQVPSDFGDRQHSATYANFGVEFMTKRPGNIVGARIYTGSDEYGSHMVTLWDAESGSLVAGPYDWNIQAGTEGWREYRFSTPVAIREGHKYTMAVSNNSSYQFYARGLSTNNNMAQPITSGDLVTFAGSGKYSNDPNGRPDQMYNNCNYFRDVIFVADETYTADLSKIAITKAPQKVVYLAGESFDPAGMEVTAFYSDNSSKILSAEDYTVAPSGVVSAEDTAITVSYDGKTVSYPIYVTETAIEHGSLELYATDVRFGAKADGVTNDREAIQRAIDLAHSAGAAGSCWTAEKPSSPVTCTCAPT